MVTARLHHSDPPTPENPLAVILAEGFKKLRHLHSMYRCAAADGSRDRYDFSESVHWEWLKKALNMGVPMSTLGSQLKRQRKVKYDNMDACHSAEQTQLYSLFPSLHSGHRFQDSKYLC